MAFGPMAINVPKVRYADREQDEHGEIQRAHAPMRKTDDGLRKPSAGFSFHLYRTSAGMPKTARHPSDSRTPDETRSAVAR